MRGAPALRPADVLTLHAHPSSLSALDIVVASPEAEGAGTNLLEAARRRKLVHYAQTVPALRDAGIVYTPLPWSARGREHPDTTVALQGLAAAAARRHGLRSGERLLQRARARVSVALARRLARMLLATLHELPMLEALHEDLSLEAGHNTAAGLDGGTIER